MLEINKIKAKKTSILLFVIFLFLILLSVLIIFTKPIRDSKLKTTVQYVLNQKEDGRYEIGEKINIQLPIAVNSHFFELTDTKNRSEKCYVLITKITGMNGPMAVVFMGNENSIELAGIAGVKDSQAEALQYGITDTMIHHWKKVLSEAYVRGTEKWKRNHI